MTTLFWLAATATMTALFWLPYVLDRFFTVGIFQSMANPKPEFAAKQSAWAKRAKSAHNNAVENLVVFAPLVLVAQAMGIAGDAMVLLAAQLYFFARLVHYVVYSIGIPGLRTVAYLTGFAAQLMIAFKILL